MKFLFVFAVLSLAACAPSRPTAMTSDGSYQAKPEPANGATYAKMTFVADQRDYFPQLLGQWLIHTMQRQTQLPEETLNLALQLNEDRTFVAPSDCGEIRGNYSVKGVSIRFKDVSWTNSDCDKQEKIAEMVRLLTKNVSLYTVNGNMLFLKDNSGNNVFRVTR